MSGRTSRNPGINIPCFQNTVLVIFMYLCFFCCNKAGSQLNSLRSQHEYRCNTSSICNPTSCNNRNLNCIRNLWNKNHRCIFSDMASCLRSLCNNSICSAPFHSLCEGNRCNYRNHFHSGCFPHFHIFFRRSCTGCHHRHSFFNNYFCYFICMRTHQHNIHTKRLLRKLFYLLYLFPYPFSRSICCPDQTKSPCLRYSHSQMIFCNPCHASLYNGIFNSKQFCY